MVAIVGRADKQMAKTRRAPERGSTSSLDEQAKGRIAGALRIRANTCRKRRLPLSNWCLKLLDVFDNKLASVQAAIDRASSAFSSLLAR
jgi:hypothetical protein